MKNVEREADQEFERADALRACAAGDRGALRQIYERDADWLLGVAHRVVRDRSLADEVVQDSFIRIWRHAAGYDPLLGSAQAWIFAIVRQRALTVIRDRGRDAPVDEGRLAEVPDCAADPQGTLLRVADAGALKGCLECLEPDRRSGLLLAYVDGYSHAQIAARLNVPPDSVKSWIRRSLAMFAAVPDVSATDREEWDAMAAEYALGLLTRAEADAVERRIAVDPGLARLIDTWSQRLAGLAAVPDPVPRPAALWGRIERGLEPQPAPPTRATRQQRPRRQLFAGLEDRLWSSLDFWRLGAAAGALAALAMAVATALTPPAGPRPTVVTVLQAEDGAPAWIVQAYADATLQVTPLRPTVVPADRALELWSSRDRQEEPVSLGLLPPAGIVGLPIGHRPPPASGDLFEVTLERADGSPTGRPTGPVLGKGLAADAG